MHGEWMIIYVLCLQVRRRVKNLVEREWERKRGRVVLEGGRRKRGSVITAVGRFVGSLCVSQQPVALTDYSGTVPGLWEQGLKCLKDTVNLMVMYLIKALLFLSAGFQRMYCDTDLRKSVSFISLLLLFQIVTLRVLSFNVRVYSGQLCVCVCRYWQWWVSIQICVCLWHTMNTHMPVSTDSVIQSWCSGFSSEMYFCVTKYVRKGSKQ